MANKPNPQVEKALERLRLSFRAVFAGTFSQTEIKELYQDAYELSHKHRQGPALYECVREEITRHLITVQEDVIDCPSETLLKVIYDIWTTYRSHLFLLFERLLAYFEEVYVKGSRLTPICDLGLEIFRDTVLRSVELKERILGSLLQNIYRERTGEVIIRHQMKSVIEMFIEIGIGKLEVYQTDFEKHFLETSAQFFRNESREFISKNTCPDYMKMVEDRRKAESDRVNNYLHTSTEEKVKLLLEKELITEHVDELINMENSGVVFLLDEEKTEDLDRIYKLFGRTPDGINKLREKLTDHLRDTGKNMVSQKNEKKDEKKEEKKEDDKDEKDEKAATPEKGIEIQIVQQLIDLKDKYDRLMENSFAKDKNYQHSINQAFEYIINLEKRVPEYLSLFADEKIKKGSKETSEEEIEGIFNKVIALFRFLQEKDIFERFYKHHLAKRLLQGRSEEDDFEKLMISKLKAECGYQFTSKLEGMFNDMRTSKEALNQFNEHLTKKSIKLPVDISIQILTTGFWPMQVTPKCTLPKEVQQTSEEFEKHYNSVHNGRRLSWQTNMGTADVISVIGGKRFEINMPTYMMCIMMLFSTAQSLTCKEIKELTAIPDTELKRNLLVLTFGKTPLLTKSTPAKKVDDNDSFSVVTQCKSKLVKFKIAALAAAASSGSEQKQVQSEVEEERQFLVDACVVRLMKTRKTMQHLELVNETTKQLSTRFMPNPMLIKKRIESLIEREYMERSKENRMIYNYLA